MRFILLFIVFLLSTPFSYGHAPIPHPSQFIFRKELTLWEKKKGDTTPTPLSSPWQINETLQRPKKSGEISLVQKEYSKLGYLIHVHFFWVRPKHQPHDYWVFQMKLKSAKDELIAECTQYLNPEWKQRTGVGSCSGKDQDLQVGISFQ